MEVSVWQNATITKTPLYWPRKKQINTGFNYTFKTPLVNCDQAQLPYLRNSKYLVFIFSSN